MFVGGMCLHCGNANMENDRPSVKGTHWVFYPGGSIFMVDHLFPLMSPGQ